MSTTRAILAILVAAVVTQAVAFAIAAPLLGDLLAQGLKQDKGTTYVTATETDDVVRNSVASLGVRVGAAVVVYMAVRSMGVQGVVGGMKLGLLTWLMCYLPNTLQHVIWYDRPLAFVVVDALRSGLEAVVAAGVIGGIVGTGKTAVGGGVKGKGRKQG